MLTVSIAKNTARCSVVALLAVVGPACAAAPERPAWWFEAFAYEMLLPQWEDSTAWVMDDPDAPQVVATTERRVEDDAVLVLEYNAGIDTTVAEIRFGACAVDVTCTQGACEPLVRSHYADARLLRFSFLLPTGEPWADFVHRYGDDGFYTATDHILPDGKHEPYARRSFDPTSGRVFTEWLESGCAHELWVDSALRPISSTGYCQQQLTEEERFSYDRDGRLARASVRYRAEHPMTELTLEWQEDAVWIRPTTDGISTLQVVAGIDAPIALPKSVIDDARRICEAAE